MLMFRRGAHRAPLTLSTRLRVLVAYLIVLFFGAHMAAAATAPTPSSDIAQAITLLQDAQAKLSPPPVSAAVAPTPSPNPAPSSSSSFTPATAPPAGSFLSTYAFSAPPLTNPVTKQLVDNSGTLKLTAGVDYILVCPSSGVWHNSVGLFIMGGRNVQIIGCTIDVGNGSGTAPAGNETQKRGAYLLNPGTFYGQDLTFVSSTAGHLTEGIDIAGDQPSVTLQGIGMDQLAGSKATNHADCLQAWSGPSVLQIDGFSCTTGYQGMFLLPDQHSTVPVTDWDLRNVHLTLLNVAYSLWRDSNVTRTVTDPNTGATSVVGYTIHTTNVECTGGRSAYPDQGLSPDRGAWPDVVVN